MAKRHHRPDPQARMVRVVRAPGHRPLRGLAGAQELALELLLSSFRPSEAPPLAPRAGRHLAQQQARRGRLVGPQGGVALQGQVGADQAALSAWTGQSGGRGSARTRSAPRVPPAPGARDQGLDGLVGQPLGAARLLRHLAPDALGVIRYGRTTPGWPARARPGPLGGRRRGRTRRSRRRGRCPRRPHLSTASAMPVKAPAPGAVLPQALADHLQLHRLHVRPGLLVGAVRLLHPAPRQVVHQGAPASSGEGHPGAAGGPVMASVAPASSSRSSR